MIPISPQEQQIVDYPAPQMLEEGFEVVRFTAHERVQTTDRRADRRVHRMMERGAGGGGRQEGDGTEARISVVDLHVLWRGGRASGNRSNAKMKKKRLKVDFPFQKMKERTGKYRTRRRREEVSQQIFCGIPRRGSWGIQVFWLLQQCTRSFL